MSSPITVLVNPIPASNAGGGILHTALYGLNVAAEGKSSAMSDTLPLWAQFRSSFHGLLNFKCLVTAWMGYRYEEPVLNGGNIVSNQYAFYCPTLTVGTLNWPIYVEAGGSNSKCFFGVDTIFGLMTAGSILFAGPDGILSQDNANLFWDNTNDRLAIGSSTPEGKLEVLENTSDANTLVSSIFCKRRTSGTAAAGLGCGVAFHNENDAGSLYISGRISSIMLDTTASAEEAEMVFWVGKGADHAAVATGRKMTITGSGKVGIGTATPNKKLGVNGDVALETAGNGHYIKEGTDATMGVATLVAGTVTVSTNKVTASSRIFLSGQNSSGVHGELTVSARTAGTSFTITSLNAADTRDIAWLIVEPL